MHIYIPIIFKHVSNFLKTVFPGHMSQMKNVSYPHDSYMAIEYPFKMAVTLETSPYPLLRTQFPLTIKRRVILSENLTNTVEWRYLPTGDGREMRREGLETDTNGVGVAPNKVRTLPSRVDLQIKLNSAASEDNSVDSNSWGYEGKSLLVSEKFDCF